jgi:hypothetical protein
MYLIPVVGGAKGRFTGIIDFPLLCKFNSMNTLARFISQNQNEIHAFGPVDRTLV